MTHGIENQGGIIGLGGGRTIIVDRHRRSDPPGPNHENTTVGVAVRGKCTGSGLIVPIHRGVGHPGVLVPLKAFRVLHGKKLTNEEIE